MLFRLVLPWQFWSRSRYPRRDYRCRRAQLIVPAEPRRSLHRRRCPILDHDFGLVNADTEFDALVHRGRCIAPGHTGLYFGRIARRIHHTAELDKQALARRLDKPSVVRTIVGSNSSARMALSRVRVPSSSASSSRKRQRHRPEGWPLGGGSEAMLGLAPVRSSCGLNFTPTRRATYGWQAGLGHEDAPR